MSRVLNQVMSSFGPRDDTIKTLTDKKYALKKALHEKRLAIKAFKDEFFKSKREFFEFQKEENARKDAERLTRQLQWQKDKEAE